MKSAGDSPVGMIHASEGSIPYPDDFYNENPSKVLYQYDSCFIGPAGLLQTTGICVMKNHGDMENSDVRRGCHVAALLFCRFG